MYKDSRGYLIFPIKDDKYINGKSNISKDCTYSVNKKNVFRGLHINTFGKLITCITGHFIDIMVNMKTYKVDYFDIKPGDQIYCPPNYAHGFISLEENSVLSYHCDGYFGSEVGGLLNYKDPLLNITLPVDDSDIIINEKDLNAPFLDFEYFLLGSTGFVGSSVLNELHESDKKVLCLKYRMNQLSEIEKLIKFYKPKYLINCAGLTGTPNTSWCNTNKKETLMTNVIEQLAILNICNNNSVHCTVIGSGAIFKPSSENKTSEDIGDLNDENNYYSKCRILLEEQIKEFNNYMYLRINYPFSYKSDSQKNLLTKIKNYTEIEDISLSITNLDSLIPVMIKMIENNESGIFNFVNKGQINIYELYKYLNVRLDLNLEKSVKKTNRESVKLYPDKLENYDIQEIFESIRNYQQ